MKLIYSLFAVSLIASGCAAIADNGSDRAYLDQLSQRLGEFYFPVPGTEQNQSVASFIVDRNGSASDIAVVKSPAEKAAQLAAAQKAVFVAVRNASPLPKPPADLHCPVRLTVTFIPQKGEQPACCKVEAAGSQVAGRTVLTF